MLSNLPAQRVNHVHETPDLAALVASFTAWESSAAIFLFPHPDDEFAVSALIRDKTQTGQRVLCIYLTDGGFGGQSAQRREFETLKALELAGVAAGDALFLGRELQIPDGRLHLHLERVFTALLGLMPACSDLFCPAWEGGHQDHDAAHLIALAMQQASGIEQVFQFSLYHGAGLPGPLFRVMDPLPENGPTQDRLTSLRERLWHLRFCLSYPSQWKTWLGIFPFVALHMLLDGRFRIQGIDARRIIDPPHAGALLYHRRKFLNQQDFRDDVAPFISARVFGADR